MLGFLTSFARSEIVELKRTAAGLVLILFALILLLFAILFMLFALYLWLSTIMQPWQAALVTAGTLLLGCMIVWLLARMKLIRRAKRKRRSILETEMSNYANLFSSATMGHKMSAIATAAVIGLILGRRMSK